MSRKKTNMETGLATNNGTETELMAPTNTEGLHFINPAEMPDLDAAEAGVSLEMKYYEFNQAGQVVRAIYNGVTKINKKNQSTGEMEQMPAVVFQTKDGVFLNSGDNLLNQLSKLMPGTPIQITYEGKEKTAGGFNVNKFNVRILNLPGGSKAMPRPAAPATKTSPDSEEMKLEMELEKNYRFTLTEKHKELWHEAARIGLIVPENVKMWAIKPTDSNVEIESKIASIDAAINF